MRLPVLTKPKFSSCLIHHVWNPPMPKCPHKIVLLNSCSWVLFCSFLGENGGDEQEPRLEPQPPPVVSGAAGGS